MDDKDPVVQGLLAMSQYIVGSANVGDTLRKVAELAVDSLPKADFAGMTMLVDGRPKTAVFTDETSPEIDATQYETGMGPCLDAFRDGEIYRIDDTDKDERWPAFSEAAGAHGIRSTISFPLVANRESMGALNVYSGQLSAFQGAEGPGRLFAAQAAVLMANSQAYWDAFDLSQDLNEAMKSRAVIEQAKGILMAAGGRSSDDAFQLLVRASQRENRKLRDIAAELVAQAERRKRSGA
jgi:GAF domain-containing protein